MGKVTEGILKIEPPLRDATDWFVENESDRDPARVKSMRWKKRAASPKNCTGYDEILRLHQDASSLPVPSRASRDELLADIADEPDFIAPPLESTGVVTYTSGRLSFSPRYTRNAMAAASLALLVCVASWLAKPTQSYVTAPGEQRELNRSVALFRVQHAARGRPFVVHAAGGTATAIGTEFDIHKYTNRMQGRVREGTLAIVPLKAVAIDDATHLIPVRLLRDEELNYDAHGAATALRHADSLLMVAWSEGRLIPLIYHGRPLTEVIEDVQRYTRRQIRIDPTTAQFQYSGVVKQDDVDTWILALSSIYPVDVIDCRAHRNRIVLQECIDPERIFIRSRLTSGENSLRSANR